MNGGLVTVPAEPVDAPVIVRLVVPFGVPGAFCPEHPAKTAKTTSVAVASPSRMRGRRAESNRSSKIPAATSGTTCRIDSGGIGLDTGGIRAVVETVTVEVCAVTPSAAAMEAGAGVQVARDGAPEQAMVTA